jgi:peptidyl-dipeptidase A
VGPANGDAKNWCKNNFMNTLAITSRSLNAKSPANSISRVACSVVLTLSTPAFAQPGADAAAKADAFITQAEKELAAHSVLASRAGWINRTYITEDTDAIAAEFGARGTELSVRLAKGAAKFDGVKGLSFDTRRKLDFLKKGIVLRTDLLRNV